jgi:hypothetical protein
MAKIPEEIKDVLEAVVLDCSSCGNTVRLLATLEHDLGWGYITIHGVTMWECGDCAEDDEEDDDF